MIDADRGDGFKVRLGDLAFAVSAALDRVSPAVAGHHVRVARIARAIAGQLELSPSQVRDILLASALHDCGAFLLGERLEIMRFNAQNPEVHAETGYRLLKSFPHFEGAAQIVRFHHLPWNLRRGCSAPLGSHLLHLADRISVLPFDWTGGTRWPGVASHMVLEGAGTRFNPEFVEAFLEVAERPAFWRTVGAAGDADMRNDPLLGATVLSEADFRVLARVLGQLVDFRSRFTATHTSGVAEIAAYLAPLAGVTGAAGRRVAIAAGLHDLGKLAVPTETLEKERPLSCEEGARLHRHPLQGWAILARVPGMEEINTWANLHHERLDGSGYPFRLTAERIPLESRIVAVADVFTALTEERPYRRGMSGREAVSILRSMADAGALDRDVVALMARHREESRTIRHLAREGAASRYLAFLEHNPTAVTEYTAA